MELGLGKREPDWLVRSGNMFSPEAGISMFSAPVETSLDSNIANSPGVDGRGLSLLYSGSLLA